MKVIQVLPRGLCGELSSVVCRREKTKSRSVSWSVLSCLLLVGGNLNPNPHSGFDARKVKGIGQIVLNRCLYTNMKELAMYSACM